MQSRQKPLGKAVESMAAGDPVIGVGAPGVGVPATILHFDPPLYRAWVPPDGYPHHPLF
jgi:hypothetical protein